MAKETELKLALAPDAVAQLRAHPLFASLPLLGSRTLDNTYFDTPDLQLQAQRMALRTRQQGEQLLQTVKCASTSTGGLSQRPEWEQPYLGSFDFTAIGDKRVRKTLEACRTVLQPVFTTVFERETRRYCDEAGGEVLLMLDQGDILAGGRVEPLCELELELVSGTPALLFELALQLALDLPLLPDDMSKAQRGYQLYLGQEVQPLTTIHVELQSSMTAVAAFKVLAFACTRQWQGNVAGMLGSDNAEFVHQMRISQRRLRSLLRLFADQLDPQWVTCWSQRFAENAAHLGPVRDLDVLCDELLPPLLHVPEAEGWALEGLAQHLHQLRKKARQALVQVPALQRQGHLLLQWVAELQALDENACSTTLKVHFHHAYRRLHRRACKRLKQAEAGDARALHRLRIALKPLRYALEFFEPLISKGQQREYRQVCQALRALGYSQDVHAAQSVLAEASVGQPQLRPAHAWLLGYYSAEAKERQLKALKVAARALA